MHTLLASFRPDSVSVAHALYPTDTVVSPTLWDERPVAGI